MLNNGQQLNIGEREYTVLDLLGKGANTTAYLALCKTSELTTKCILKEYTPHNDGDFEQGKARFISAGKMQNEIRQQSSLVNQTPPVSHIFEAQGTAFVDVACFGGMTLDKLTDLSLLQYMQICLTIAKTVGYYHTAGYLCLDLKPENIFVMQNSPDDTITQLVEFIDFDSLREISTLSDASLFSYTKLWAAPEQLDNYGASRLSTATDIYTIGEIVFYLLFGRHSTETEHRGFSKYPFDKCKHSYRQYVDRPDVQSLFIKLFRSTLRSSPNNRFQNCGDVVTLLTKLTELISQKEYIVPRLPHITPIFVGRESEMQELSELLSQQHNVFVTGIGGIGKSTIVRNFIHNKKTDYDIIVYLEFDGDFCRTFNDDTQLQISTISKLPSESGDEYFKRKLSVFKRICTDRKALFVLDNFSGLINKDLSRILECGYDTIIVSRNQPPRNSFESLEILSIADREELLQLISYNLGRQITKDERECFEKIIVWVFGHTLVLELIARQIAAGKIDARKAQELIYDNGFTRFSGEKIDNYKDGEQVYDTLSDIVSVLFDAGNMSDDEKNMLKILSLADVRGLEAEMLVAFFDYSFDDMPAVVSDLVHQGWVYIDDRDDTYNVHPVIAEAAQNWEWADSFSDVKVMDTYKLLTDIYAGMDDDIQIELIVKDAERFKGKHPRHFISAMYLSLLGTLYDVQIGGRYDPIDDEERQHLEDFASVLLDAVEEMEQSSDKHKPKYLIQMYLDTASVLIRCFPEYHEYAAGYLQKVSEMVLEENCQKSDKVTCYFFMTLAWYHTFAEPDLENTYFFASCALETGQEVFDSPLELIDSVLIPSAECFCVHKEYDESVDTLKSGIELCKEYPKVYAYIDKHAQLLNCMLDVYYEMGEFDKCRELITQIDELIENNKENRMFRDVDPYYRKTLLAQE